MGHRRLLATVGFIPLERGSNWQKYTPSVLMYISSRTYYGQWLSQGANWGELVNAQGWEGKEWRWQRLRRRLDITEDDGTRRDDEGKDETDNSRRAVFISDSTYSATHMVVSKKKDEGRQTSYKAQKIQWKKRSIIECSVIRNGAICIKTGRNMKIFTKSEPK